MQVKEKAHSSLDSMRALKSSLEGSDIDLVPPSVVEANLLELKRFTLMHLPHSLTDAARESVTTQVELALKGIISIVLC